MKTPYASVLMAVHDENPAHLSQAIESILAQSLTDFELLIIDDESTQDDTQRTLAGYASRDNRIILRRVPHQGLTSCLNAGLSLCRGELVFRHDSDDWSEPSRFSLQAKRMSEDPTLGMIGSFGVLHQEDGTKLWTVVLPTTRDGILTAFSLRNPFFHGAACIRKRAALAIGGYRPAFSCGQDYDFFARLCEAYGGENLPLPLYHHRRTATSISIRRPLEQIRAGLITRELIRMRRQHSPENLTTAISLADATIRRDSLDQLAMTKRGDQLLLAGRYKGALEAYLPMLRQRHGAGTTFFKLARLALFTTCPPLRRLLF